MLADVRDVTTWDPDERGWEVMTRVEALVAGLPGHLARHASLLLDRHAYRLKPDGEGPHANPLGHPLFELPIWLAGSGPGDDVPDQSLLEICESSLCGYLAVRAEDDYFDGASDDPGAAMTLSGFFRARHQALLAPLLADRRFWMRFERVWRDYGEAMLLERSLHHPSARYGRDEFDLVLQRSQPLEIPGDAVLTMKGCWDRVDQFARMVRHLNTATQLFDDFVDAPEDLESGNLTWMVRRLGGLEGSRALRRGMITCWDEVVAEVRAELDPAARLGEELGLEAMASWVAARRQMIEAATERMYGVLFGASSSDDPADLVR